MDTVDINESINNDNMDQQSGEQPLADGKHFQSDIFIEKTDIMENGSEMESHNKNLSITFHAGEDTAHLVVENGISSEETFCKNCPKFQEEFLEEHRKCKLLEEACYTLKQSKCEFEGKLEQAIKQKDFAMKEKESMVVRYAVSEKSVLEQKHSKEQFEKKYKESLREIEILQHKLGTMISEKARICQMLDNKCYELKTNQQELERTKADLGALETKLKWSQNSLKTEMELRKESDAKVDALNIQFQEVTQQIEDTKKEAQESIKSFYLSQDNRAHVLDQQLKEQQAQLILLKHERDDREHQVKTLQGELDRLQTKQKEMLQENNELSLKVQHLERDRLENEQKLSELRNCADQQKQDTADLNAKSVLIEQLKLQLKNEKGQLSASNEQMSLLKQRNSDLENDMEICRVREAELLLFTQQLTDKNVRLQSEFTSMETKVQQLTCEQSLLKRGAKEHETKANLLASQLSEVRKKTTEDVERLSKELSEKSKLCETLSQEASDQKGENSVLKRKFDLSLREVNKELQQCRKKLDQYENLSSNSSSSSNTSLNHTNGSPASPIDQVKVVQPERVLDKQTLIEHIVKLQRISARKSEKLDFLEEHVNTLVAELQKKSRLLQSYILREQAGTLSSNSMDSNKAQLAKFPGVMASMYSSRVSDNNLTLELSLDINRKLQAVLEDTLLKNITLKENVDTLGGEIERLNKLLK